MRRLSVAVLALAFAPAPATAGLRVAWYTLTHTPVILTQETVELEEYEGDRARRCNYVVTGGSMDAGWVRNLMFLTRPPVLSMVRDSMELEEVALIDARANTFLRIDMLNHWATPESVLAAGPRSRPEAPGEIPDSLLETVRRIGDEPFLGRTARHYRVREKTEPSFLIQAAYGKSAETWVVIDLWFMDPDSLWSRYLDTAARFPGRRTEMNADSLEEYVYRAHEPSAYPLVDLRSRIDSGLAVRLDIGLEIHGTPQEPEMVGPDKPFIVIDGYMPMLSTRLIALENAPIPATAFEIPHGIEVYTPK